MPAALLGVRQSEEGLGRRGPGLDQPLIQAMIVDHRETGGLEVAAERHGEGLRVGPEQAKGNRRQPVQNQPSVS